MNFNLDLDILIIFIGILIIYVYGIITVLYKVFPNKELRKIKHLIFCDTSTKGAKNNKIVSYRNKYYLDRISFFEEHSKKAEIENTNQITKTPTNSCITTAN